MAAWIGAVMNTRRLADKTSFNVLLWGGIVGSLSSPIFGLGAMIWSGVMIAYLIAGPDGMAVQPLRRQRRPRRLPSSRRRLTSSAFSVVASVASGPLAVAAVLAGMSGAVALSWTAQLAHGAGGRASVPPSAGRQGPI